MHEQLANKLGNAGHLRATFSTPLPARRGPHRMSGLHILQHALGVDQHGCGDQYRSHFVTGEGSKDHPTCMTLVEQGLMTRRAGSTLPFDGDDLFHVTDDGRAYVAEHSPAPPKLTAGQKRYRDWLDGAADWMSFGDWLKSRTPNAALRSVG